MPSLDVPNPGVAVAARRHDPRPVGAELDTRQRIGMAREDANERSGSRVPDPGFTVLAGSGDQPAIRAEGDGGETVLARRNSRTGAKVAASRICTPPCTAGAATRSTVGADCERPRRDVARRARTRAPISRSATTRSVRSASAVSTSEPSLSNTALVTTAGWLQRADHLPAVGEDPRRPSSPPSSTRRPSGLNTAAHTGPWKAARMCSSGAVPGSQTRAVSSAPAVTTAVPSGANPPSPTASVCPRRTAWGPTGRLPPTRAPCRQCSR